MALADAPGTLIGSGRIADVHALGPDRVLKLYRSSRARADAFQEAAILAIVADHDLPAPQVVEAGRYDGRWGLVMSRAPGDTLAALALAEPGRIPACLDAMVRIHVAINACREPRLRAMKPRLAARIETVAGLPPARRAALLRILAALPDGDRICHGDLHPLNLVGTPEASIVVDWPDATSGPPEADAARSYLLLLLVRPDLADEYLARYCKAADRPVDDVRAWLPVLAAARLAEGIGAEEQSRLLGLAGAT